MIKISLKVPNGLKDKIARSVNDVISSKKFKDDIGKKVVQDIQRNARSGNTIDNKGDVSGMTPLETSTIRNRASLREAGNATGRPYADQKSNLTISGQLINSIKYVIGSNFIKIFASGDRTPYKNKDGTNSKADPINNEDLMRIHHYGGLNLPPRPVIGLRKFMKLRILVKTREYLRRSFEKSFKVKNGS
jgi:hypothetical protein